MDICGLQEVDKYFIKYWRDNPSEKGRYIVPYNNEMYDIFDLNEHDVENIKHFVNAIYIKNFLDILDTGVLYLDDLGRSCVWVKTQYGYIYTTHLPYTVQSPSEREEYVEAIRDLIYHDVGEDNFWLTGDFNLLSKCSHTPAVMEIVNEIGINATYGYNTWHGYDYEDADKRYPNCGPETLDFIVSSLYPRLKEVNKVREKQTHIEIKENFMNCGTPASDHYCVMVVYELKKPKAKNNREYIIEW